MMNSNINRPNQKFDHVYIVMRYDSFMSDDPKQAITTLKVYFNESEAVTEAERLNKLRNNKDNKSESEYYVTLARINKKVLRKDSDEHH